jgi:hypothetical protein
LNKNSDASKRYDFPYIHFHLKCNKIITIVSIKVTLEVLFVSLYVFLNLNRCFRIKTAIFALLSRVEIRFIKNDSK